MTEKIRYARFDQVKLLTTKNVNYLSAPPDTTVNPHGVWSVVAAVDQFLLLSKNNAIIKIPACDVLMVERYSLAETTKQFGNLLNVESFPRKSS